MTSIVAGGDDLGGHLTAQSRIAGAIHLAHSAFPEQADDFVGADTRTDSDGHAQVADYTHPRSASGRMVGMVFGPVCR